ncbi:hypothetical protein ETU08_09610 [Apibacter muscae]|uniref:hypothetical protein n=1 Tax=Apibacter muscae TaxID=2509004 RepID=UPI0011ABEE4A|nr:hypothetical protein [Apibacter muscae]TWP27967.1 hypothetical protein ETU08_09610 [Apibacter muscae]
MSNDYNNNTGLIILNNIPDPIKPGWGCFLLFYFNSYIDHVPYCIKRLQKIAVNPTDWSKAKDIGENILKFSKENPFFVPSSYLTLAHNIAKMIDRIANPSSSSSDRREEWKIPFLAMETAIYFKDSVLENDIESTLSLFTRVPELKNTIKNSKDFVLFKRINDILWINWYSDLEHDLNPTYKYQNYLPDIFILKKSNASIESIANRILQIEKDIIKLPGDQENCKIVASAIYNLKY